jgi:hypothetical protein
VEDKQLIHTDTLSRVKKIKIGTGFGVLEQYYKVQELV